MSGVSENDNERSNSGEHARGLWIRDPTAGKVHRGAVKDDAWLREPGVGIFPARRPYQNPQFLSEQMHCLARPMLIDLTAQTIDGYF